MKYLFNLQFISFSILSMLSWTTLGDCSVFMYYRLEASFALWEVHIGKPSTYVLKPRKLGALREVAHNNMVLSCGACFHCILYMLYHSNCCNILYKIGTPASEKMKSLLVLCSLQSVYSSSNRQLMAYLLSE